MYSLVSVIGLAMTKGTKSDLRVAVLAGRRIDQPGTTNVQFPLDHVNNVERQLRMRFVEDGIGLLVCSAACGADLSALKIAAGMGIDRIIVLPFDEKRFLQTSVLDRPGNWKNLYEKQIEDARRKQQLIVLKGDQEDAGAYSAATGQIVAEAIRQAASSKAVAYVVWEGKAKSDHDETESFRRDCKAADFDLREIDTLAG